MSRHIGQERRRSIFDHFGPVGPAPTADQIRRSPPSASPEEVDRVRREYRGPVSDEEAARHGFPSARYPTRPGESSDAYRRRMNPDAAAFFGPAGEEGARQAMTGTAVPVFLLLGGLWLWKRRGRR